MGKHRDNPETACFKHLERLRHVGFEFDQIVADSMGDLELSLSSAKEALARIPVSQRTALEAAADRVRSYHEHQKQDSLLFRLPLPFH